ncbi:MAG: hypothetical protein ACR5K7_01740 [Symbiopectobacterium sp.]
METISLTCTLEHRHHAKTTTILAVTRVSLHRDLVSDLTALITGERCSLYH